MADPLQYLMSNEQEPAPLGALDRLMFQQQREADRARAPGLLASPRAISEALGRTAPQPPQLTNPTDTVPMTPYNRLLHALRSVTPEPSVASGIELAANIIGGPKLQGIRAFHGSPHKFDKFDMSRIGTGEGAQSYGHGLYFAEKEAVARDYRDQLSNKFIGGKAAGTSPEHLAAQALSQSGRDAAIGYFSRRIARGQDVDTSKIAKHLLETNAPLPSVTQGGHMYEVNIRARPEQFLDWDRPLRQMGPEVQTALNKAWLAHPDAHARQTGGQIYESARIVPGEYRDPNAASKTLRDAGIPGIKYLDQGSRGAGQGTSNYVLFDDSIIDILKRYGLMGGAAAGPLSQLMQQPEQ